jgi:hypothetical protein
MSKVSRLRVFELSGILGFKGSKFRSSRGKFKSSRYQGFEVPGFKCFRVSRYLGIRGFKNQGSRVSILLGLCVSIVLRFKGIRLSRYIGFKFSGF